MAEKKIRVSFAVDERSAQAATRIIQDLTRQVEKLAQASARAGGSFSGMGGTSITNKKSVPGLGGQQHRSSVATQKGGGVVGNLLGGSERDIKGMVQATEGAMRTVSSSVKQFVSSAERDIDKLSRSIEKLNRQMRGMGGAGGGGMGGMGGAGGMGATKDMALADTVRDPRFAATTKAGPPPVRGRGPLGRMGRGIGIMGRIAGGAGGGGGVGAAMRAVGSGRGIIGAMGGIGNMGAAGVAGAGVLGAAAIYEFGTNAMLDDRAFKSKYKLQEPVRQLERRAAMAEPFQQLYAQATGGDVAGVSAFHKAVQDPEIKKVIENVELRKEQIQGMFENPTLMGTFKRLGKDAKSLIGMTVGEVTGLKEIDPRMRREIMREVATSDMGPKISQQIQKAAAAKRRLADPRFNKLANDVYQGAMGRAALGRSVGIAAGSTKLVDGNVRHVEGGTITRRHKVDRLKDLKSRLTELGITPGQYAAGYQNVLGIGRGYMGRAVGVLEDQIASQAGLRGTNQMVRSAGMLSGAVSNAGRFYDNVVQGSVGRGGLDAAVGSQLFPMMQQRALASGDMMGTGNLSGYLAARAGGIVGGGRGTPFGVAEQQIMTRRLGMGMGVMDKLQHGQFSPLQSALGTLSSVRAAGGFGLHSQSLTHMSTDKMAGIVSGGELPEALKATFARKEGESEAAFEERIRGAVKSKFQSNQKNVIGSQVGIALSTAPAGSEAKRMLTSLDETVKTGGGIKNFLDEEVKRKEAKEGKMSNAERARFERDRKTMLGKFLSVGSGGKAGLPEEIAGFLDLEGFGRKQRARGAGARAPGPKKGSADDEALEQQSEILGKHAKFLGEQVQLLAEAFGLMSGSEEGARRGVADAGAGGRAIDNIEDASGSLVRAVISYTNAIKRNNKRTKGPVKASQGGG